MKTTLCLFSLFTQNPKKQLPRASNGTDETRVKMMVGSKMCVALFALEDIALRETLVHRWSGTMNFLSERYSLHALFVSWRRRTLCFSWNTLIRKLIRVEYSGLFQRNSGCEAPFTSSTLILLRWARFVVFFCIRFGFRTPYPRDVENGGYAGQQRGNSKHSALVCRIHV